MAWSDYKQQIQLAETPQELQIALVASVVALLDYAQARADMQAKQPTHPKQAMAWVEKNCKFAKKR